MEEINEKLHMELLNFDETKRKKFHRQIYRVSKYTFKFSLISKATYDKRIIYLTIKLHTLIKQTLPSNFC